MKYSEPMEAPLGQLPARHLTLRDPAKPVTGACACINIAYQRTPPGHAIVRQRQMGVAFLECVVAGRGWFVGEDGERRELRSGSLFTYGHDAGHSYGSPRQNPMQTIWFSFAGTQAEQLQLRAMGGRACCRMPDDSASIISHFLLAYRNTLIEGIDLQATSDAYLNIILQRLIAAPQAGSEDHDQHRFARCQTAIDRHCCDFDSVHPLCADEGISFSYLCRLFRRYGRETPHAYLVRKKLEHAAMLLITSNDPVATIAEAVGFRDAFHFSRSFKARFGRSPLHYRQQS